MSEKCITFAPDKLIFIIMKIYYIPSVTGSVYFKPDDKNITLEEQVVETQGLLSQLALHAGVHVEIPPYPIRLADYHRALMEYDKTYPKNMFHASIAIDSMSVAKTLLGWRDNLRLAGWNCHVCISDRFDALSVIETNYEETETGLPVLLKKVKDSIMGMTKDTCPNAYKEMEIKVACPKDMLPDYLTPLFDSLEGIVKVEYGFVNTEDKPEEMEIIEFSEQYKAEAWMSQMDDDAYDVWINSDNKRLDNWLHMSGKPVAGSDMLQSNPQITQMFLLAIQLFQRPLNVNVLLQYLYLPECPLPWKLKTRLASTIVREGGFCSNKVLECINDYLNRELKDENDETPCELTPEQRKEAYRTYLPFDLLDEEVAKDIVNESDEVNVKRLNKFLKSIRNYVSERDVKIAAVMPYDLRPEQLREVKTLIDALMIMTDGIGETIQFSTLQQWAQSLYEASDFHQFNPQVGCRQVENKPFNIVTKAKKTIWCDFFGDVSSALTTDFLSPREIENMQRMAIRLWSPEREARYRNFLQEMPLHQTSEKLTFVVCKKRGATDIPVHPLRLQLPNDIITKDGDEEFAKLPSRPCKKVNNHREEDAKEITFDAKAHPVTWREQESFSALEELLQNPLDYFLKYTLGFTDKGPTEIKMSLTYGNVAHEVIESLFTAERGGKSLPDYTSEAFDTAFQQALARKGALLLLPKHHLGRERLHHQLIRCVNNLAEIIEKNRMTVIKCEQEELQQLEFEGGIMMKGFIDMVLKDDKGKDVIFDLKWTSKKDKYKNLIESNRDAQLAIYRAMMQAHELHPDDVRTAFFVMPQGKIISSDDFADCHFEKVGRKSTDDIMEMLRKGYAERRKEISEGRIETSNLMPITEIEYANIEGVFPLEKDDARPLKKAENKYSDYKCFTL